MGVRVAIAMAVYNDARYLERTLAALAGSHYRDFSVVLVDDGSTDDSIAVAERFTDRLPLAIYRAEHRGIYPTKRDALERTDSSAPFVMTLDSDIILPPHALGAMVELLEHNDDVAVVSARALAVPDGLLHRGLRYMERAFHETNSVGNGARWIVGGCAMYRRAALETARFRVDMGEDAGFAEQLRDRWRLLCPAHLEADHLGEPANLRDLLRRGAREGMRVAALHRQPGATVQLASLVRLVPLPLALLAAAFGLARKPIAAGIVCLGLLGYMAAFVVANRKVRGPMQERTAGAFVFTWGNLGFGYGYLRQWLRGSSSNSPLGEGSRTTGSSPLHRQ
jgi:hypothetical protein